MNAADTHEAFALFPAYCALVTYLRPANDVLDASPGDLVGVLAQSSEIQAGCMIVAHCPWVTEDPWEGAGLALEIRAMCEQGRRPRYANEMGISIEDVLDGPSDG